MSSIKFKIVETNVGLITIDRPEKRNAFSTEMRKELTELLQSDELSGVHSVVLHGAGKSFSAGADLSEVGKRDNWTERSAATRLFSAFRRASPVIIAAVHGHALGLGSGLAMASDLVVADAEAEFGYPEVRHGLVAAITMVGLKELVGNRKALELLVTGRRIPAQEALVLGMVNEVVNPDDLLPRAMTLAREIGAAGLAARVTKRFFYESNEMPYTAALQAGERVIELMRTTDTARSKANAFTTSEDQKTGTTSD